jgi:hypothetical protein
LYGGERQESIALIILLSKLECAANSPTKEEEEDYGLLLLTMSTKHQSSRVVVVRMLLPAAVVVGWVVFAVLLSSQYYFLQRPAPLLLTKNNDQVTTSLIMSGNANNNKHTNRPDVNSLTEKQKMFQKRIRQWLLSSSSNRLQPPNTPGAFIHVSKTGGSTLSSQLRNGCHSWMPKPCSSSNRLVLTNMTTSTNSNTISEQESFISRLSTYYHIPDFPLLAQQQQQQQPGMLQETTSTRTKTKPKDNDNDSRSKAHHVAHNGDYAFYVWTVRDPLERTISSFVYQHPANIQVRQAKYWQRLYQRGQPSFACFPTLERFATALGDVNQYPGDDDDNGYPFNATTVNNTNCTRLARAIMDNKVAIPAHLYYSFHWLLQQHIFPTTRTKNEANDGDDATIHLAIRTEHLWDDWTTANQWLGQDTVTTFSDIRLRKNNDDSSEMFNYPVKREISAQGQERLCRALKKEYQAYMILLQRAVNLSEQQRQDSLNQARQNCPILNLQFDDTA